MKKRTRLTGMKDIINNLNKAAEKIKNSSVKGLIEASIIIRRSMEKTPPKIPVDTSNLRSSWFVTTARRTPKGSSATFKGEDSGQMSSQHSKIVSEAKNMAAVSKYPLAVMGFTANYATKVHEDMETRFKRPGSGPKFFEAHLRMNEKEIVRTLQENTKI